MDSVCRTRIQHGQRSMPALLIVHSVNGCTEPGLEATRDLKPGTDN